MHKENEILKNAPQKTSRFNDMGLHYNLVAEQVDKKRLAGAGSPFDEPFLPYIVAGLISFDMGRWMGKEPYDLDDNGFAARLQRKLRQLEPMLEPLLRLGLPETDLEKHSHAIEEAYELLSEKGAEALHSTPASRFHVGATKILHFLNPNLFIIIDSNASRAFKCAHGVRFSNTTQPGYSAERYFECMQHAKHDIAAYGSRKFQALDPDTPITRIYDKLTFITGYDLRKDSRSSKQVTESVSSM